MLLFYLSLIESEADKSKFERLYNEHSKLMKYIAIQEIHDEYLAEDAVHEAFIKLTRLRVLMKITVTKPRLLSLL